MVRAATGSEVQGTPGLRERQRLSKLAPSWSPPESKSRTPQVCANGALLSRTTALVWSEQHARCGPVLSAPGSPQNENKAAMPRCCLLSNSATALARWFLAPRRTAGSSISSRSRPLRRAAGLSDAPAISNDPAALTIAIGISTNLAVIGGALTMSSNLGMVSEIAANRYLVVASLVHPLSSRSFPFN